MSVDDCVWKVIERDPFSSTFADVKRLPLEKRVEHSLYKCIPCDGLDYECLGYKSVVKLYEQEKNRRTEKLG